MTPPSAAHARARQRIRRGTAPRVPRRVSGPAARPRAGAVAAPRLGAGALALPRIPRISLPDSRFLDRLLRGPLWIGIVGFALIGIVFMQVSLLKLNAGIGHAVEKAQSLERVNSDLRAEVSQLGSNERIQQVAERLGLELPPPGAVTFLGKDGRRMGGDGVTALAVGTQTGPAAAGTAAGAMVPGASAQTPGATTATTATTQTPPAGTATTATTPAAATPAPATQTPAPAAQQQQQQQQPTPTPTPTATAAGGATAPTG